MTVAKGAPWGRVGILPDGGPVVADDAALRAVVEPALQRGEKPVVGLLGGDLARTCGATGVGSRLHGPEAMTLPVDAVEVTIGDERTIAVAHVVVRRSWWWGPVVAAMNAQFLGDWDVAPRSHPNDGRVDVLRADLGLGDRYKARARLPLGTHVPHPGIEERRQKESVIDLPRGHRVWIDGEVVGSRSADRLVLRVRPDAFEVVV